MKPKHFAKSLLNSCLLATLASFPLINSATAQTDPGLFTKLNVGNTAATTSGSAAAITGDGTVLAEGKHDVSPTLPWGGSPTAGSRMLWYPRKSAFRAGYGDAQTWAEAAMGKYSVAMGYNSKASGSFSTAMGYYTTSSQSCSTAMGVRTTASGHSSTAMGTLSIATGSYSTAMGYGSTASGTISTAMGSGSFGVGDYSTAMGAGSFGVGDYSTVMGMGNIAHTMNSTVVGRYNKRAGGEYGDAHTWHPEDRLFEIGNGSPQSEFYYDWVDTNGDGEVDEYAQLYDPEIRSNALTVYKNGNMELQGNLTLGGTITTSAGSSFLTTTTGIAKGTTSNSGLLALGNSSSASGQNSTAIGASSSATGTSALALGQNTIAKSISETVIGRFNKQDSAASSVSWNETDVLFRVGNGSSALSLSDAITTLKNGNTTLTNKGWKAANPLATPSAPAALANPGTTTDGDSDGNALVVDGHTVLNGKVIISVPQGDISMGIYQ